MGRIDMLSVLTEKKTIQIINENLHFSALEYYPFGFIGFNNVLHEIVEGKNIPLCFPSCILPIFLLQVWIREQN